MSRRCSRLALLLIGLTVLLTGCWRQQIWRGVIEDPTPWWHDAVCYEVFVRSFQDSDGDGIGDLRGLTSRLDYINDGRTTTADDLGANCIWLMPIAESPSYHGYDVSDFTAVERDYGTTADFKEFVAEAHRRGIKVVLDYVMNHTSSQHPWFVEASRDTTSRYRDWYLWSREKPTFRGPWGQEVWPRSRARAEYYYALFWDGMPDLNYRNPAVRAEAERVSAFWLGEMGVDGLRIDAARHIIEEDTLQQHTESTRAWLREYGGWVRHAYPRAFTIGEIWDSTRALVPYYPDELDSYFAFQVAGGIVRSVAGASADRFNRAIDSAVALLPSHRWAPFLTNHDQNRVLNQLGGDRDRARIAAIALLTIPGMPFIYYGEEIGMSGAKPDERIRTPMQWSAEARGAFTTGQAWQARQPDSTTVTVAAQDHDPHSLLNLYRMLIHLRANHPALSHGSFTRLESSDPGVSAFIRQAGEETILVMLNFGDRPSANPRLTVSASPLLAGFWNPSTILGEQLDATFRVGTNGAIADYAPEAVLAPHSGSIFRLRRLRALAPTP